MEFQAFKKAVIAQAEAMGIGEYELYYQVVESTSVGVFQDTVNQFTANVEGGVCFRCIVDGKMGYAATELLDEAEAKNIVGRAYENAAVLEADEPVFLCPGGQVYELLTREPYALADTETLIAKAMDTQKKLYRAGSVDGCTTQGVAERMGIAICNSLGLDLEYENQISGLVVGAVVSDGEEKANDYQIKLGKLDEIDTDELTEKAVDTAKEKLGGEVAPTGMYPVIFNPEAMSSLLSAFSSVFSSESAQKGLSKLAEQEGKMIASEWVTLVDDPFCKESPMPMNFDAEGCPTFKKNVIEKGKLKTLLYNMKTAAVGNKKTTGNASKGSYSDSVGVRPFSMYLEKGSYTEQQLLEKAGNGVYINSLSGLHAGANPVSGDFSLQSAGYLIENGLKTKAVKSFTVAGNFYELLKNITALADNCTLPNAMGATAFGAPSVLAEGLSIAGK